MTKTKKSRHRTPVVQVRSDPVDERYQAEVDACTRRLEARYRKAEAALERAERRAAVARQELERTPTSRASKSYYQRLQELVDQRREELLEIERLMMPTAFGGRDSRRRLVRHESGAVTVPLGATNRGRGYNNER